MLRLRRSATALAVSTYTTARSKRASSAGSSRTATGPWGFRSANQSGHLLVRNGIETFGGVGESLVKGVVMSLPAAALSIKPGGYAQSIEVTGGLTTNRVGIPPIEMQGGVSSLRVSDIATGAGDPK